jgi:hypothetical protein
MTGMTQVELVQLVLDRHGPILSHSIDYGDKDMLLVDGWRQVQAIERTIARWAPQVGGLDIDNYTPSEYSTDGIDTLFDEMGFTDEYGVCSRCSGILRTTHDSYSWQLYGWRSDARGLVCGDCLKAHPDIAAEYVSSMIYVPGQDGVKLIRPDLVDLDTAGWVCIDNDTAGSDPRGQYSQWRFENSLHPGDNDDPRGVGDFLVCAGIPCLFSGSVAQFGVSFWVWVPLSRLSDAVTGLRLLLDSGLHKMDHDPGTEIGKVLRGESSDHYTLETRTITQEQFLSGDWQQEGK